MMKNVFKATAITFCFLLTCTLQAKEKDVNFKTNIDVFKAIKSDLVKADGRKAKVSKEMLKKRFILVYFSAHWCPPCRKFTPQLVKWYNKDHKDFTVILVSADEDKVAMTKYMEETKMPWIGMKKGSDSEKLMSQKFQIGPGIPNLVLIEKGQIITSSYKKGKYLGPKHAYDTMISLLEKSKKSTKKK